MPDITGASLRLITSILKAGSAALNSPSLTLITIPLVMPTSLLPGMPVSVPVVVLKLAQLGLLLMLNVSGSLSASLAVGVKLYALSCATEVAGVPEIIGASLMSVTLILKAGSAALNSPSLTRITIPSVVPTSLLLGVPMSAPVVVLKLAQLGLLLMLNVRVSFVSMSVDVGVKL